MKLLKLVKIGERIPRGYGFCYYDLCTDSAWCAPVVLNVVISFFREWYNKLVRGRYCSLERMYDLGYTAGIESMRTYWERRVNEARAEGEATGELKMRALVQAELDAIAGRRGQ